MNKTDLVADIAGRTGQTKTDVDSTIAALCEVMEEAVARGGQKITVPGYFSVERTRRSARTGRNPQTGEQIQIPAANSIKISAGSKLKSAAKAS